MSLFDEKIFNKKQDDNDADADAVELQNLLRHFPQYACMQENLENAVDDMFVKNPMLINYLRDEQIRTLTMDLLSTILKTEPRLFARLHSKLPHDTVFKLLKFFPHLMVYISRDTLSPQEIEELVLEKLYTIRFVDNPSDDLIAKVIMRKPLWLLYFPLKGPNALNTFMNVLNTHHKQLLTDYNTRSQLFKLIDQMLFEHKIQILKRAAQLSLTVWEKEWNIPQHEYKIIFCSNNLLCAITRSAQTIIDKLGLDTSTNSMICAAPWSLLALTKWVTRDNFDHLKHDMIKLLVGKLRPEVWQETEFQIECYSIWKAAMEVFSNNAEYMTNFCIQNPEFIDVYINEDINDALDHVQSPGPGPVISLIPANVAVNILFKDPRFINLIGLPDVIKTISEYSHDEKIELVKKIDLNVPHQKAVRIIQAYFKINLSVIEWNVALDQDCDPYYIKKIIDITNPSCSEISFVIVTRIAKARVVSKRKMKWPCAIM